MRCFRQELFAKRFLLYFAGILPYFANVVPTAGVYLDPPRVNSVKQIIATPQPQR
jgi:hypothetical protein